jgi:uncharacterized membrane protein YedE/YeeE
MQPKPYVNPYLAGVGIGLVLLTAYATAGRGLGASGAFASVVAAGSEWSAAPLGDWLVLELVGVVLGGFASAWAAGRFRRRLEGGPHVGGAPRMVAAMSGGMLMGFGARLARGCTSGQALSGGALLSAGSWIFIAACFAAGYTLAPLARRLWR